MTSRRRGLGRGLDALLGAEKTPSSGPSGSDVNVLPIDALEPNRFQPRTNFDESGLDELAESIRAQGVVQPIVVSPSKEGGYTIIAGERRWRASRLAGLETVPVVVREVSDDRQMLEMALVENVQRADLNAIEESEAYRSLADTFGLSQEQIASRVGKGRTTITNALRLLRLPQEIQDALRGGQLTAGQARPLLALSSKELQIDVANRAITEGLTARNLEALVSSLEKEGQKAETAKQESDPVEDVHTRAALEALIRTLQTKVEIKRRRRGGVLKIHFHNEDELIRLYDRLIQQEGGE